jgi:hypothetical protein
MVSLYDLMLDPFKGVGHYVVMDSTYMGDAICQVGREEWKINMVGTVQSSWTGGGRLGKAAIKAKEIEKGTHKSLLYQHNTKPLLLAVWADNNFVKTLSNFHSPTIVEGGMKRRVRDPVTMKRAREQTDVDCNEQQIDYCVTYHHIDKGNGAEAKYDLSTVSHLHGWGPKLASRYFNMNLNNAYKIFYFLYKKYHPEWPVIMPLNKCIHNLTHSLLQRGDPMRKRGTGAPPNPTKDITTSSSVDGRKVRKDSKQQSFSSPTVAHGTGGVHTGTPRSSASTSSTRTIHKWQHSFKRRKTQHRWRCHQSVPNVVTGSGPNCRYSKCPGLNTNVSKRSYQTKYRCEECSINKGVEFWLCNTVKKVDGKQKKIECHLKYHAEMCFETTSTTESSVASELTEE